MGDIDFQHNGREHLREVSLRNQVARVPSGGPRDRGIFGPLCSETSTPIRRRRRIRALRADRSCCPGLGTCDGWSNPIGFRVG